MIIFLNGKKEEITESMSLSKLLDIKKIRPEVVTVELNEQIVERNKYSETLLNPDDYLEFVYYMGGGGFSRLVREFTVNSKLFRRKEEKCLFQIE